ncbi:hypothetical protein GCM10010404_77480 [Nonomuraea africana]
MTGRGLERRHILGHARGSATRDATDLESEWHGDRVGVCLTWVVVVAEWLAVAVDDYPAAAGADEASTATQTSEATTPRVIFIAGQPGTGSG